MGYLVRHSRLRIGRVWQVTAITLVFAFASVAGFTTWRAQAQRLPPNAVELRPTTEAQQFDRGSDDRGGTYRWLESRATRTSTRFSDAIAVSERDAAGEIRTRLTSPSGTDLATLKVVNGAGVPIIEYRQDGAEPLRATGKQGLHPTLEWGTHQAYLLWKEQQAVRGGALEWQGSLMRPRGADPRSAAIDPVEVRTEWPDGVVATARRTSGDRRHVMKGTPIRSRLLTSRLAKDGIEIGHTQWYEGEQVIAWVFPGLTEGFADPAALQPIGGLPFTPDLGWANVQSVAFYTFHTAMKERGTVSPQAERRAGLLQKVASMFVATVEANEPGCDGLHWLDYTVFRPCCDYHDLCYEKFGCTYKTWWQVWTSWWCDVCNAAVVFCFGTGGKVPFRQSPN